MSALQARILAGLVVAGLSLAFLGEEGTLVLLINGYFWWLWREHTKKRPPWIWEACLVVGAALEIAIPRFYGETLLADAMALAIAAGWYAAGGWLAARMPRRDEGP